MSDLQIGLAVLGVLLVAAVVAFNWWQERQFRQRGEDAFPGRHDDVLLGHSATRSAAATASAPVQGHALDEPRIEPSMEPSMEPRLDIASGAATPASAGALKFTPWRPASGRDRLHCRDPRG